MPERDLLPTVAASGPLTAARATFGRRDVLKLAGATLALLVTRAGHAATSLLAVRIWPAAEYTRITLESAHELKYTSFTVSDPERLVVDLEGVNLDTVLQSLPSKVLDSDPYLKLVRAGQNRPGVVRLVIELKTEVKPQIFALQPVGDYGHRLVLDLYPAKPVDPLLALIDKPSPLDAAAGDRGDDTATAEPASQVSRARSARGRRPGAPDAERLFTVALDPGHGGEDPGAIGHRGTFEKQITLEIGRRLKRKIDAEPNMRAVLTRDDDYFVPLGQRVTRARRVHADLFVSIHADAFVRPDARGSSVFVLSERGASSSAARWLAKKQNEADLIGGVNLAEQDGHLARTLLDLSQTAAINDSMKLGRALLASLGEINTLHRGEVEEAAFAVLKAPDIPSVLVETAFISNPDEERRLNDDAYQDKMAEAILHGIRKYFEANPPVNRATVASLD